MEQSARQPEGRVRSVDVLRGWALVCMVLVHFAVYFGDESAVDTWIYFFFNHVLGDWGAGCFLMMMGMSQVLSGQRHEEDGGRVLLKRALIRGIFIFAAGLVMLALAWGPSQIWQWDILTLMGFATVLLFFCRRLPSAAILMIAAALAVATPWFRGGVDFNAAWGGQFVNVQPISRLIPGIMLDPARQYIVVWRLADIVRGFLVAGYFPLFPWMLFPLLGLVLGRRIVGNRMGRDLPFLIVTGLLLATTGLFMAAVGRTRPASSIVDGFVAPLSFYPDSFTMILFQTGMALVVFGSLYCFYDVRNRDSREVSFIVGIYNRSSRFSLTFYFLHYLIIGWPLAIVHLVSGKNPHGGLMGVAPALACGVAGVVLLELLLFVWERHGSKYSLEWVLGSLTRLFAGR